MTFSYTFDPPQVEAKGDLGNIIMPGLPSVGNPGEPTLPLQAAYILLPPDQDLIDISVHTAPEVILAGQYQVAWGQKQWPLSSPGGHPSTPPDAAIYSSSQPFPRQHHHLVGVWPFRGHRIAVINLYPVRYRPADGALSYFPQMTVHLQTVSSSDVLAETTRMLRSSAEWAHRVNGLVYNPEALGAYNVLDLTKGKPQDSSVYAEGWYPYVIITDQSLTSAFQALADFKTGRGLNAKVITTQEIAAGYPGGDLPEQIRNCILDAYTLWQTDFVLLGGDDEVVPHRGLYAQAFGYVDADIPSDLYYGALDGNWNDDGDALWGEPGEEDAFAEILVGRAPVDDVIEAQYFVDKVIHYEEMPVLEQTVTALMAGEELFDNPQTWGGDYKDEIRYGSTSYGYTTTGFPPHFLVSTLYDRDLGFTWWGGLLLNQMNDGLHLINHVGHTSVERALRLTPEQVLNDLTNDGITNSHFLIYSQGCYAASFDNRNPGGAYFDDCVAEAFVVDDHGAVAFVGNSRYGWAEPGATNGASQYFDRQFFDALFGEQISTLGSINDDSKIDNLWALDFEGIRWCYYEQNILGDPSLDVWTDVPENLTVIHPEVVTIDEHNTFIVVVKSGDIKIPGALVCIRGGQDVYSTAHTNSGGIAYMSADPTTPETLDVCVTVHNYLPYSGKIPARAAGPSLWYSGHQVDDNKTGASWGNGDGVLNSGETIELTVRLHNFGDETAQHVTALLTTADAHVTVLDSLQDYPDIPPEEGAANFDPYIFTISGGCPDGQQIEFAVQAVVNDEPMAISTFSVSVSAPKLAFENAVLNDDPPQGNGDGILEAGESALLMVTIRNTGSTTARVISGELSAGNDPYIQVDRSSAFFPSLDSSSAGSGWPFYKVTASSESPPIYLLDYFLHLSAGGDYSATESIPSAIGPTGLFDDIEDSSGHWKTGDLWHITGQESHSPSSAWYAGLDSTGGYPGQANASLTSERIVLLSGSCLSFWHRYELEENEDFGYVEIYNDTSWVCLNDPYTGISNGWVRECYDLSYRPNGSVTQIRFRLTSDEQGSAEGWFLDDVTVGPPPRFWLDAAQVFPDRGTEETTFTFSIVYFSDRNYAPTSAQVFIDDAPHVMTTADSDFTQGTLYTYSTNLDLATHQYHFEFSSGLETVRWPRLSELPGPLVVETIYQNDFEENDGGYLVTGDNWEWGVPTSGPQLAWSGQKVWATRLDGNYASSADARLETGIIDLIGVLEPQLSFWHWFSFEYREANYDGGNVKVSCDGGDFQIIEPLNGYEGIIAYNNAGIPDEPGFCSYEDGQYWHQEIFDLTPFTGHHIAIRFHMGSNSRYTYPGWYIDDVIITGLPSCHLPEVVSNLKVNLSGEDVLLNWDWCHDHDPAGFVIYRGIWDARQDLQPESLALVKSSSYLDLAAAKNTASNYFYQVRALMPNGQQMEPSEMVGEFDVHIGQGLSP